MKHSNISIFIPHLGCPFNCIFCDQYKITGSDIAVTPYDVYKTLNESLNHPDLSLKDSQIAFFGGSFTAINRSLMTEYLEVANKFIGDNLYDSIRISTRPDCIDENVLKILKEYNVKTIELGIQSLDNTVLKSAKRGHTAEQSIEACKLIQNHGFELGMQMMCGLPGDNQEKDIQTALKIIEIGCKQVRIYPVVVIEGTELCTMYKQNKYTPLSLDEAVSICAKLYKMFTDNDVTILKMGLHTASDSIAGPFHPAFGELVRSEAFYNEILTKLNLNEKYIIEVSPDFISIANGNKKRNIIRLNNQGYNISIKQNENIQSKSYIIKSL